MQNGMAEQLRGRSFCCFQALGRFRGPDPRTRPTERSTSPDIRTRDKAQNGCLGDLVLGREARPSLPRASLQLGLKRGPGNPAWLRLLPAQSTPPQLLLSLIKHLPAFSLTPTVPSSQRSQIRIFLRRKLGLCSEQPSESCMI